MQHLFWCQQKVCHNLIGHPVFTSTKLYRVAHLVADLGWLDLDLEYSTICPILLGWMGIRQKKQGKLVEHKNPSQHNPSP